MANTKKNYCRLCAELKPANKLFDLEKDCSLKGIIMEKLTKLNVRSVNFCNVDKMPKNICFVCNDYLDKTLEFLSQIDYSQNVLRGIFIEKIIKEEGQNNSIDSEHDFPYDELETFKDEEKPAIEVKTEYNVDSDELQSNICSRPRKIKKRKKINTLEEVLETLDNDIPLSRLKCTTWKDYPWFCLYCNNIFLSLDELRNHSMEAHQSCTPFKCLDCQSAPRKTLDKFMTHVYKHKKNLQLCCYICNEVFSSVEEVKLHQKKHYDKGAMKCSGCNTRFENYDQYKDHSLKYYRLRIKKAKLDTKYSTLICKICDKTFATRGNLNKHQQIHMERYRDQTCEKCGKTFYDKGTLTSHMLLHEDSRKYKCEICRAGFRTASQLRTHVGIHGGPRPYSCDQCGRCFRLRTHLKSHLIIHTDNLPHICEYCSKAFRFKTILTQHLRQHTGVKPYSCEHCLREFTNWPNYNKHMKRRHSIDMSKKKHTPEGVFPINPLTGEILPLPDSSKTDEWKKKVLLPRQRGRPKLNITEQVIKIDLDEQISQDIAKIEGGS